jgi:hypothetical protein
MTAVDTLWDMIPKDTQNYIVKQFNGLEKAKEMENKEKLRLAQFTSYIHELGKSNFNYALITNVEILELYNESDL